MQAFAVDAKDRALETWADPACGTIGWQTLISRGLTDSTELVCGIAQLQAGMDFALHHHAEAEIYFGLDGTGTVMIDGSPHRLAPGIALFIPPNAIHGVPPVSAPLRYFYVFAADSFDDITYHFRPLPDVPAQAGLETPPPHNITPVIAPIHLQEPKGLPL